MLVTERIIQAYGKETGRVPHHYRRAGADRRYPHARTGEGRHCGPLSGGTGRPRSTERKFIRSKYPILGVPILRGAVTFISSMITGVKALMFSADYFPDEEDAQPGQIRPVAGKAHPRREAAIPGGGVLRDFEPGLDTGTVYAAAHVRRRTVSRYRAPRSTTSSRAW